MFVHYRTEGFIIRKENRGESDQTLTIYAKRFGKIEILGRAMRKISSKLRSGSEIFYLSDIEFIQGKGGKTLTDAILIDKSANLRKSLKRLSIAYKIAESLDDLIKEQEPDEKIWQLFGEVIGKLNDLHFKIYDLRLAYYLFLWNLLSILGFQIDWYHCSACQKKLGPDEINLQIKTGGLVCNQCLNQNFESIKIDQDTLKIVRLFLKRDWKTLSRLKADKDVLKSLESISAFYLNEIHY